MHQSTGKKNKIIIYLLFLFILSTTSTKFINDQKKLSLSIFLTDEDSVLWLFISFELVVLKMNKNSK